MIRKYSLLVVIALSLTAIVPASAYAGGTEMQLKGKGFGPPAFRSFCGRLASLCNTRSGARVVQLDGRQKTTASIR